MTDGIRPVSPLNGLSVQERRQRDRRDGDRRKKTSDAPDIESEPSAPKGQALVPVQTVIEEGPARPALPPTVPAATFAAQVIGQGGDKRGIKGGPPVLDAARSTYLGTEYSGKNDRRPAPGQETETEI